MRPLFVTGIGTGIGKTVVSAVLVESLKADYWKPVQSGDLDESDTLKVQGLVSNTRSKFHPEAYRLTQPFSPHKSADLDGINVDLNRITVPSTNNNLIIEGAGGLMVPLNSKELIIDLIENIGAEVILVSQNYLGSINHTLLSISLLRTRDIPIKALIFNGGSDSYSEEFIIQYSGIKDIIRIPEIPTMNKDSIETIASSINLNL